MSLLSSFDSSSSSTLDSSFSVSFVVSRPLSSLCDCFVTFGGGDFASDEEEDEDEDDLEEFELEESLLLPLSLLELRFRFFTESLDRESSSSDILMTQKS